MLLNLFLSETSPQMMSTRNRHWRRTLTHPQVHSRCTITINSAHQNLLHYCELEYLDSVTAMNYAQQNSALNWTHWGSSWDLPAPIMLWSDWILRFPCRAGSPELRWGGTTGNQPGESHEESCLSHTLPILPRDLSHWQWWVWLRILSAALSVKTPPDSSDFSHTAVIPLSKLSYPRHTSPILFFGELSLFLQCKR